MAIPSLIFFNPDYLDRCNKSFNTLDDKKKHYPNKCHLIANVNWMIKNIIQTKIGMDKCIDANNYLNCRACKEFMLWNPKKVLVRVIKIESLMNYITIQIIEDLALEDIKIKNNYMYYIIYKHYII